MKTKNHKCKLNFCCLGCVREHIDDKNKLLEFVKLQACTSSSMETIGLSKRSYEVYRAITASNAIKARKLLREIGEL